MKKIVYVISDIDKALSFEWVAKGLQHKMNLIFILIGKKESELSLFLKQHQITCYEITDQDYPSTLSKWIALFFHLKRVRPDTVHTHLWRANLLGLTTSWLLRIKQRIYTRHHATTHYREHPSGRKWDKLCNTLATDIIAISKNVEEILIKWDGARPSKIKYIPHGFDFNYFESNDDKSIAEMRSKYKITSLEYPVVGVISRYMELKGIQFIIPAFQQLRTHFPNAKLILANAHGEYEKTIKRALNELPADSYVEIRFEKDLNTLYRLFNVFVHTPIDPYVEAFGQTYIEPLIIGVPSVFTLSGIAREFVQHKENAWVVDFEHSDQIEKGIRNIIDQKELSEKIVRNGKRTIQDFSLDIFLHRLETLYNT